MRAPRTRRSIVGRYRHVLYGLSTGGILLGIAQGVGGIAFSDIFTNFLTQLFSALIALIFGAPDPTNFGGGGGFFA